MARLARVVVPGFPHHITQRGVRKSAVFLDGDDRRVYWDILAEHAAEYRLSILSYCWMTNHVHLISLPEEQDSLYKTLRDTHGLYASYFNRKHGFCGHLWQARFFSCVLDQPHFWSAVRYVESNPVRAGLVGKAEEYPWSSAAPHCGLRQDSLLTPFRGDRQLISAADWSTWLAQGSAAGESKDIRQNTKTGRPFGSDAFLQEVEKRLARSLEPKKRGRKKVKE